LPVFRPHGSSLPSGAYIYIRERTRTHTHTTPFEAIYNIAPRAVAAKLPLFSVSGTLSLSVRLSFSPSSPQKLCCHRRRRYWYLNIYIMSVRRRQRREPITSLQMNELKPPPPPHTSVRILMYIYGQYMRNAVLVYPPPGPVGEEARYTRPISSR